MPSDQCRRNLNGCRSAPLPESLPAARASTSCKYLCHVPAAHPSSGIGNDTVTAELVTAILHFDIGSGMLCRAGNRKFLIFFCMIDINDIPMYLSILLADFRLCCCPRSCLDTSSRVCNQSSFFSGCYPIIMSTSAAILVLPLLPLPEHNSRPQLQWHRWIHLFCFMKHLSGFTVCHICHRTGVDHIDIRSGLKRNDFISTPVLAAAALLPFHTHLPCIPDCGVQLFSFLSFFMRIYFFYFTNKSVLCAPRGATIFGGTAFASAREQAASAVPSVLLHDIMVYLEDTFLSSMCLWCKLLRI